MKKWFSGGWRANLFTEAGDKGGRYKFRFRGRKLIGCLSMGLFF